ncbi:MAG: beta-mannosidase, partial [Sphingobacteriales bacterium]
EKIFLNFKGINRKADIYVNGSKVGSLDGFMQPGHFDVTGLVNKTGANVLAVLTYCPKTPLVNYASPTYISAASWDWMPYVPGLNSGITDKVWLTNNGNLTIKDPWIRTDLPTNGRADLTIAVDVENSAPAFVQGEVKGVIQPGNVEFTQKVFIGANSKGTVKFDKRKFAQLAINNPKLWWPNGYGDPNLYTCTFTVSLNGQVSDAKTVKFGIKKYTYDTDGGVLHIWINGTRVFLKGGNWGMSEYMLRCRGDEYFTKVKYHKEMNFNMIRNWIGSTTDDEFYEACDQYGIMIWDDFWLNSIANLPNDIYTFNMNAVEKIKRFRNHPAIAIWCGDNEGFPEPPLNGWLKENINTYDGNDRYYQANSKMPDLTGSGPWTNTDITWYFAKSPNGFGGNPGWGLRSEIGTAVFTNFESFKKFMPKENWWPRDEMWNKHFFGTSAGNASPDRYDAAITKSYGAPTGIEDYCRKAQLLNLETNRAMYEGWLDNMWEDASGILTWMSQSAYPSFVWQTYDYYYDLNGAYWGAKKACEPLHIQWNPVNNSIKVINTTRNTYQGLTAELAIYNKDGSIAGEYSKTGITDAAPSSATTVFEIPFAQNSANLALGKKAYASTSDQGSALLVTDGRGDTRWASLQNDREWIYIDLEKEETINGVGITWEEAYARGFRIEVSNDAKTWDEVYSTGEGSGGVQKISFDEVKARYVRMAGVLRASGWGYSIWEFEVYGGATKAGSLT